MTLKGYLITDPECEQLCEDAVKRMGDFIGADEVEVIEASEALRLGIDLGNAEGVPVMVLRSETTGKQLTTFHFHDEEGNPLVQPCPAIPQEGSERQEG